MGGLVGEVVGDVDVLRGFVFVFLFACESLSFCQVHDRDWNRERVEERLGVVIVAPYRTYDNPEAAHIW